MKEQKEFEISVYIIIEYISTKLVELNKLIKVIIKYYTYLIYLGKISFNKYNFCFQRNVSLCNEKIEISTHF